MPASGVAGASGANVLVPAKEVRGADTDFVIRRLRNTGPSTVR